MNPHKLFGFGQVDQTADAAYYIRFLDNASADPSFQAYKRHTATLLAAVPGRQLLDVGCGTGDDARMLAALVAPGGEVVGVDSSQAMIAEARRRDAAGLPVRFEVADAHGLPFADARFDGSRCDRTFMHLADPEQALREMARVTKVGGRVVVYEVDFGAITIDMEDKTLARKIIDCWCDSVRDGWRGRRVPGMFREVGLVEVDVTPAVLTLDFEVGTQLIGANTAERARSLGIISADEARTWIKTLEELRDQGRFFCTLTGFLVSGCKKGK